MKTKREFLEYAERHGFKIVSHNKHIKLKKGNKRVVIASSPSCPYAYEKAVRDINKALKELEDENQS